MQTRRDNVQRTCIAQREISTELQRHAGGGERDSDASNESDASDALQRSGAGARQSREAGSINERKDAWRRESNSHSTKWQNMANVHGSPSTCQGRRRMRRRMVSDRSRGGAIRSGTWPARWCRSTRHQSLRHRRTLGTLQPQPTASWRWRDTSGRAPLHRRVVKLAAHCYEHRMCREHRRTAGQSRSARSRAAQVDPDPDEGQAHIIRTAATQAVARRCTGAASSWYATGARRGWPAGGPLGLGAGLTLHLEHGIP
jgi:hypothetical protein